MLFKKKRKDKVECLLNKYMKLIIPKEVLLLTNITGELHYLILFIWDV